MLSSYTQADLQAMQERKQRAEQLEHRARQLRENKLLADALLPSFALTGSNLPADSNPAQLHLF